MPTPMIDGLEVDCVTQGCGQPLRMLAPGGFDATDEKIVDRRARGMPADGRCTR